MPLDYSQTSKGYRLTILSDFSLRTLYLRPLQIVLAVIASALIFIPGVSNAKYASIVIDSNSGQVRHSVNADTRNYPASLTKLMTLYLLFEAIERKKLRMNTKLKVSKALVRGEQINKSKFTFCNFF